jgi:hypothetical protein
MFFAASVFHATMFFSSSGITTVICLASSSAGMGKSLMTQS